MFRFFPLFIKKNFTNILFTEDIRDATHTPKREGRHLSLTFGTVLGGNIH